MQKASVWGNEKNGKRDSNTKKKTLCTLLVLFYILYIFINVGLTLNDAAHGPHGSTTPLGPAHLPAYSIHSTYEQDTHDVLWPLYQTPLWSRPNMRYEQCYILIKPKTLVPLVLGKPQIIFPS